MKSIDFEFYISVSYLGLHKNNLRLTLLFSNAALTPLCKIYCFNDEKQTWFDKSCNNSYFCIFFPDVCSLRELQSQMMEQRYSAKTIGEVGKSFIEIGKLYLTIWWSLFQRKRTFWSLMKFFFWQSRAGWLLMVRKTPYFNIWWVD